MRKNAPFIVSVLWILLGLYVTVFPVEDMSRKAGIGFIVCGITYLLALIIRGRTRGRG